MFCFSLILLSTTFAFQTERQSVDTTSAKVDTVEVSRYFTTGDNVSPYEGECLDSVLTLTEKEGLYLDSLFGNTSSNFTLVNKNVLFLSGSAGRTIMRKSDYLYSPGFAWLFIIIESPKLSPDGLDAIIVFYSKARPSTNKILRIANRYSKRYHNVQMHEFCKVVL